MCSLGLSGWGHRLCLLAHLMFARPAAAMAPQWSPASQSVGGGHRRALGQDAVSPPSMSTSLPPSPSSAAQSLHCPAGWYAESGAAPPPAPVYSRRQLMTGVQAPPPPAPNIPTPPPPIVPGMLDPCKETDSRDKCRARVATEPCSTPETIGLTCFTINKYFHFAFVAGASRAGFRIESCRPLLPDLAPRP